MVGGGGGGGAKEDKEQFSLVTVWHLTNRPWPDYIAPAASGGARQNSL